MKVELSLEHAEVLLGIGRDFRRICSIVETCPTTEQEEALGELKEECASIRKWRLRQSRLPPGATAPVKPSRRKAG